MSDQLVTHPSPEELSAFGLGRLDEETLLRLETHISQCSRCIQALEELAGDAFVNRLREAVSEQTTADASTQIAPGDVHDAPTAANLHASSSPSAAGVPAELANHPRYRVLQVLGAGGMGVVYQAEHLLMERPVALKVISHSLIDDPAAVERFRREVKAAARLSHPNIVTAYDADQAGDLHFLVMEYVEGVSLDRILAQKGRLSVVEACSLVRQAALGLQHALERGMAHRDIKPQNLMVVAGSPPAVKILDFGLARFARETAPPSSIAPGAPPKAPEAGDLTQLGDVMGTPDYIAPEQIRDARLADIRADIYSLGCTLYHLLRGQVPFPGMSGLDKLMAHHEKEPRPLSEFRQDLPAGLVQVIQRMMAKNPDQRYQTPAAVAEALAVYTTAEGARVDRFPAAADAPLRVRRRRLLRILVVSILLGTPVLLFLLLANTRQHDPFEATMETLYTACAIAGGALILCQFLMSVLGLGHHHDIGGHDIHDVGGHDVGHDASHNGHAEGQHDGTSGQSSWFAGVLTFRTVVTALTFFGLAGRAFATFASPPEAFAAALVAGSAAFFGVAVLMKSIARLKAEGTVYIQSAVGQTGTVYVTVPSGRSGAGKVLLNLQNRTMEYQAVTTAGPLATGSKVTVVAVLSSDTVEVIPV
jgi:predicted Ser/Thr protein kinase